jgi:hypothetical protein
MQNRVTVRGESPRIVEEARAQQLLNRQRLNSRTLKDRIKKEASLRYDVAVRKGLDAGIKEGGQLEFAERKAKKIRVTRRSSERGFLLLPHSGFDAEGKIYVRSAYGANPYAYATSFFGGAPLTLALIGNTLKLGSHPSTSPGFPGRSGNLAAGYLNSTLAASAENTNVFTLEFFVHFEESGEYAPTIEYLGGDSYRFTTFSSYFGVASSGQGYSYNFNANKHKYYDVIVPYPSPYPPTMYPVGLRGLASRWQLPSLHEDRLEPVGPKLGFDSGRHHFAIVASDGSAREYIDGTLIRTRQFYQQPGNGAAESVLFSLLAYVYKLELTGQMVYPPGPLYNVTQELYSLIPLNIGFSSVRFTPGVELYSGTSFTPPTFITDLA